MVVELAFVGVWKQVIAALRAQMHDRRVQVLHGRHARLLAKLVGCERDDLPEQIACMAVLECGRQASGLLSSVAENQHLAPVVRQTRIFLLRRLLGKLRLDERRKGLLAPCPEVVDATLRIRRWLAHGTAVERLLPLTIAIEPERQVADLVIREAIAGVEVAGPEVEPHDLGAVGITRRARQELQWSQRPPGLAPEEREPVERLLLRVGEQVRADRLRALGLVVVLEFGIQLLLPPILTVVSGHLLRWPVQFVVAGAACLVVWPLQRIAASQRLEASRLTAMEP